MYYNCIYVPIFNYFLIFVGLVCAAHVEFIIRRIANSLKVFIEHYYLRIPLSKKWVITVLTNIFYKL